MLARFHQGALRADVVHEADRKLHAAYSRAFATATNGFGLSGEEQVQALRLFHHGLKGGRPDTHTGWPAPSKDVLAYNPSQALLTGKPVKRSNRKPTQKADKLTPADYKRALEAIFKDHLPANVTAARPARSKRKLAQDVEAEPVILKFTGH